MPPELLEHELLLLLELQSPLLLQKAGTHVPADAMRAGSVTCCFCLSCRRRARALEQCAAESPTVVSDGAALIHGHISWSLTQNCCCSQKHQQKQRAKRVFPVPPFQIYCPSLSLMTYKWKPAGKEVWEMKFTSCQSPLQTGVTPGVEQWSSWSTNNLQNSPFTLFRLHFHPSHT